MPIRINTTDALELIVKELISKNAASKIKQDKSKVAKILAEIDALAKEVESELSNDISKISASIQAEVDTMFTGMSVVFETGVGKFDPEKAAVSYLKIMEVQRRYQIKGLEYNDPFFGLR